MDVKSSCGPFCSSAGGKDFEHAKGRGSMRAAIMGTEGHLP